MQFKQTILLLSMGLAPFFNLAGAPSAAPIDNKASPATSALFHSLREQMGRGILFGHHHTTAYGIGWKNDPTRSDVKAATGSFPSVYGWDMGHKGTENMRSLMVEAFERGGINTISWHMKLPITDQKHYATGEQTVAAILPGGPEHELLVDQLDGFADFATNLRDSEGTLIPIIFRPWHEHTGNWFWWGIDSCTPEEYVQLWRFTVEYLRDTKGVHNLLYAYSPSQVGIGSIDDYEQNRFPGYEYIDLLGIDCYTKGEDTKVLVELCEIIVELADKNGKAAALTEFGYRNGINMTAQTDWYSASFLEPFKASPLASRTAFALPWRNSSLEHYWIPIEGDHMFEDFQRFARDPFVVFEDQMPSMYSDE